MDRRVGRGATPAQQHRRAVSRNCDLCVGCICTVRVGSALTDVPGSESLCVLSAVCLRRPIEASFSCVPVLRLAVCRRVMVCARRPVQPPPPLARPRSLRLRSLVRSAACCCVLLSEWAVFGVFGLLCECEPQCAAARRCCEFRLPTRRCTCDRARLPRFVCVAALVPRSVSSGRVVRVHRSCPSELRTLLISNEWRKVCVARRPR